MAAVLVVVAAWLIAVLVGGDALAEVAGRETADLILIGSVHPNHGTSLRGRTSPPPRLRTRVVPPPVRSGSRSESWVS